MILLLFSFCSPSMRCDENRGRSLFSVSLIWKIATQNPSSVPLLALVVVNPTSYDRDAATKMCKARSSFLPAIRSIGVVDISCEGWLFAWGLAFDDLFQRSHDTLFSIRFGLYTWHSASTGQDDRVMHEILSQTHQVFHSKRI